MAIAMCLDGPIYVRDLYIPNLLSAYLVVYLVDLFVKRPLMQEVVEAVEDDLEDREVEEVVADDAAQ